VLEVGCTAQDFDCLGGYAQHGISLLETQPSRSVIDAGRSAGIVAAAQLAL